MSVDFDLLPTKQSLPTLAAAVSQGLLFYEEPRDRAKATLRN